MHGGLLTDVVQSHTPAARVHGRPERQQNDLICMAADLPESVHAAAQTGGSARGYHEFFARSATPTTAGADSSEVAFYASLALG